MTRPNPTGSLVPFLRDVKGRAVSMVLPPPVIERRNLVRREALVRRIAAEFRDMPGLVLTVKQASRLLAVDEAACERILGGLASQGILRRRDGGSYGVV